MRRSHPDMSRKRITPFDRAMVEGPLMLVTILWLTLTALGAVGLAAPPKALEADEAEERATLVVKLTRLVTWPESAFPSRDAPLRIGVLGTHPFGKELDRLARGKLTGSHPLEVKYGNSIAELEGCRLIYVARNHSEPLPALIKAAGSGPILWMGEEEGFAEQGGMVNLLIQDGRPRLQINPTAAATQGIGFAAAMAQARSIERIDPQPHRK